MQDGKNRTCVDINECRIVDDVCGAGECFNTEGSFHCRCRPGHKPDELSKVCVGKLYNWELVYMRISHKDLK